MPPFTTTCSGFTRIWHNYQHLFTYFAYYMQLLSPKNKTDLPALLPQTRQSGHPPAHTAGRPAGGRCRVRARAWARRLCPCASGTASIFSVYACSARHDDVMLLQPLDACSTLSGPLRAGNAGMPMRRSSAMDLARRCRNDGNARRKGRHTLRPRRWSARAHKTLEHRIRLRVRSYCTSTAAQGSCAKPSPARSAGSPPRPAAAQGCPPASPSGWFRPPRPTALRYIPAGNIGAARPPWRGSPPPSGTHCRGTWCAKSAGRGVQQRLIIAKACEKPLIQPVPRLTGLNVMVRRFLWRLMPRRRFSSCLISLCPVWVASLSRYPSARRAGRDGFDLFTSSRPANNICAPDSRQVMVISLLRLKCCCTPKRAMVSISAKLFCRSVRATSRTTNVERPHSASSMQRVATNTPLPLPAPPKKI